MCKNCRVVLCACNVIQQNLFFTWNLGQKMVQSQHWKVHYSAPSRLAECSHIIYKCCWVGLYTLSSVVCMYILLLPPFALPLLLNAAVRSTATSSCRQLQKILQSKPTYKMFTLAPQDSHKIRQQQQKKKICISLLVLALGLLYAIAHNLCAYRYTY